MTRTLVLAGRLPQPVRSGGDLRSWQTVRGLRARGEVTVFGLERAGLHLLMVGSIAALIGVLLFVITVIDFPFQGSVRVEPHAMERVLSDLPG